MLCADNKDAARRVQLCLLFSCTSDAAAAQGRERAFSNLEQTPIS
jgi:hypothetical protein